MEMFEKFFGFSRHVRKKNPGIMFLSREHISKSQELSVNQSKTNIRSVENLNQNAGSWKDGWIIRDQFDAEIVAASQNSEFSLDSTEITEITREVSVESTRFGSLSIQPTFKANEIVWAKSSGMPWFPGIVTILY